MYNYYISLLILYFFDLNCGYPIGININKNNKFYENFNRKIKS